MAEEPDFNDRWLNNLPDYVSLTPVEGDPFDRAAQRTRQSVKPEGGRTEGVGTDLATKFIPTLAKNLIQPIVEGADTMRRASEGNVTSENPEDIWKTFQSAGTIGAGALPFAERGALGSAGGKLMQMENKAPPFYSALEHAVENTKQQKMPADQWLGTISNSKGVKPEELDWTGFKDFLAEKGKQPVTKQELQDHLNANKVELKEVDKGTFKPLNEKELSELEDLQYKGYDDPNYVMSETDRVRLDELTKRNDHLLNNDTKYSEYQLPGGENYREMLLTLPKSNNSIRLDEITKRLDEINELPSSIHQGSEAQKILNEFDDLIVERKKLQQEDRAKESESYKSSHWDEPNILAHVRMNDRNIEGKKSLHLEEIQSDWHQQGRDKGYKLPSNEAAKLESRRLELETLGGNLRAEGKEIPSEIKQEWADIMNKLQPHSTVRVPDAPFKKSWHELALKRMIREAAEKGYDRLSWTPGEAQAARYDLSKQIDNITLHHDKGEKGGTIQAYDKKGNQVIMKNVNDAEKELPDIIGKEATEKLLNQPSKDIKGSYRLVKKLENADLKVGGEGMKGFYDQIIPKAIEKIGKEHGVKVKTAQIQTAKPNELLEKLKENDYDENTDIQQILADNGGRQPRWLSDEDMTAIENFEHQDFKGVQKVPVHYIDIPQSLKDVATQKGFPLFSSGLPFSFTPVDYDPHKTVNNANHVPYGAGASNTPSGYPVNIDSRIPQHDPKLKLPNGEPADLHKYLTIHEIEEYKAMKAGVPYHKAHHDIATPMEKKAVESDGVDWRLYEHIIDGFLKKTEEEGFHNTPKNLYLKPYHSRSLIEPPPKKENEK